MPRRDRRKPGRRRHSSLDETFVEAIDEGAAGQAQAAAPKVERQNFGSAWIEVEIDADGQLATVHQLSFGGDAQLTAKEVYKALAELFHIAHGLNKELVDQLASQACASPGKIIRGKFPVARGTPPVPGKDGRIDFTCLGDPKARPSGEELKTALAQTGLEAVMARKLNAPLVVPGQELAVLVPPTQGEPGRDVLGNLSPKPGKPAMLRAGPQVRQAGDRFLSETFGYLCLSGEELSVLPPIWVSPDRLEAHFVCFPQDKGWRPPQIDWLRKALQLQGVRHGIQDSALESLRTRALAEDQPAHFLIARGTPPVPGADAHIDYTFNPDLMAGKVLEDGSIDLKERNAAISVSAKQLLGQIIPATKGQPGTNVLGEEIPTTDGAEQTLEAGENVRVQDQGGTASFYAQIDGVIVLKGNKLAVHPVFQVNGDIDYQTGNLEVLKDVHIKGCVRAGFAVKAGGNIAVGEVVEDGAQLHARGDVVVARGIAGENARVVALGNVETKFIQNSAVMARGDIIVGSYIFNARVRAGGRIIVKSGGGERGGSIVGGQVHAAQGIEARLVGSPSTGHTIVGIGPPPETAARLDKLRQVIAYCDASLLRLLRTLGLPEPDATRLKALVQKAPPTRKQFIVEAMKKVQELVAKREEAGQQQRELEREVVRSAQQASIKVTDKVYAGACIDMGRHHTRTLSADLGSTLFVLAEDGIRSGPLSPEPP
jgi:uncharacterized protein (DUF342 family)